MEITLTIPNTENFDFKDIPKFEEIFIALIQSGGLSGVKNGKTIIHFDGNANFQAIQLDYYPFKKRAA